MANVIQNERQYELTKAQLAKLELALAEAEVQTAEHSDIPEIVRQGHINGIRMLISDLQEQMAQYEKLRNGQVHALELHSVLEELPSALVRARIARGWTHKELANLLGTSAQQVQKDEAGGYSRASLDKLIRIAAVLDVRISGRARLAGRKTSKRGTLPARKIKQRA